MNEPQKEIVSRYIELLTGKPDTVMHWRFLPDDPVEKKRIADHEKTERIRTGSRSYCVRRNYDGTVYDVWPDLLECQKNGWGIFAVVNEGGRNKDAITKVRKNFIDMDGKPLPVEDFEWHVQPNFIVQRDTERWHAYWASSDCPLEHFEATQKRLAEYYGADAGVADLPRIMRVPGTWHHKHMDGQPSQFVKLIEYHDHQIAHVDLVKNLPELPAETERKEDQPDDNSVVSRHQLRSWLSWIDPGISYPEWYPIIAAIHNTPLENDDYANDRRQIARDWSAGLLDRKGRYEKAPPDNFDADVVDAKFVELPPRKDGYGWKYLRKKVRDTAGWAQEAFGDTLSDLGEGENASQQNEGSESKQEDLNFDILRRNEFTSVPLPSCIIDDVIQENGIHILFGKSETAKTFFVLHVAGCIITGLPLFEKFKVLVTGDVVFCEEENPADAMTIRWPAWCKAHGVDPFTVPLTSTDAKFKLADQTGELYVVTRCPMLASEQDVKNLVIRIRQTGAKPKLIIIDTLAAAMYGLDENASQDFGRATWAANYLRREFGCATLFVHHPQKSDPQTMRGTSAQINNVDVVWHSEGDWQALKITNKKWKSGGPNPKPFHLKGQLVAIDRTDKEGRAVSAPVLTYNADAKTREPDPTNGKEQTFRSKVIASLRVLNKAPIPVRQLAEKMTGGEPKGQAEYITWDRKVHALEVRLSRGVFGRTDRKSKLRLAYLSDLAECDSEGEPIKPVRFILPDHYRVLPGELPMLQDHDDLGD